jgi:hypothetical protein
MFVDGVMLQESYPGGVWLQWLLDFFVQGDEASF